MISIKFIYISAINCLLFVIFSLYCNYNDPTPTRYNSQNCLWHNANRRIKPEYNRIQAQREWMKTLAKSVTSKKKNILVHMSGGIYTFNIDSEHSSLMCPSEFKISDKCNFVRVKDVQIISKDIYKYDAILSAVNGIEKYEDMIWKLNPPGRPVTPHIYFTKESPISPYVPSVNLSKNNKILASYWRNSDIPVPYQMWINSEQTKHSIKPNATLGSKKNYAKGKSKMVAMLISNCKGRNDRLKYALELRKYIPVDIYGRCSPERNDCGSNCFKMLKQVYKFYLAFENANCREYITEKLHRNAYQNDIVPIVMGAHPKDYKTLAPPHSYIHVEDFSSPRALAKYLIRVSKNDALYNKYFAWKTKGHFVDTTKDFFCRVCAMIIYSDIKPKPAWPNNATLKTENKCLPIGKWYWSGVYTKDI